MTSKCLYLTTRAYQDVIDHLGIILCIHCTLNTNMNAVADYIVERGWAGDANSWFYTKWNSGYIEVESTRYLNATSGWTVYGKTNSGNTYANAGTWGKTYTFDVASGLFSGAPTACQLTCDWDCFAVADDMVNWTNTFIKTIIFSSGGMGVDNMLRLNIKLGGRWK